MVSTKLDTRIPQFARGQDVELFLHPPGRLLEPGMLGGSPFYTCALSSRKSPKSRTCVPVPPLPLSCRCRPHRPSLRAVS